MNIWKPPKTAIRLVTQNLLVSAAAATEPDREVTEENVEDLAAVISLSCLYDQLVLVGPQHLLDFNQPLLTFLRNTVVATESPSTHDWEKAVKTAERYAGAFLGIGRLRNADQMFERMYHMSRRYGLDNTEMREDGPDDIELGKRLLSDVRSVEDVQKFVGEYSSWIMISYVLRTFLYIAFSDRLGMPIAVDAARQPLVAQIADDSQRRVREIILETMADGARSDTSLRRPVRRIASPFAAIVFNESKDREGVIRRLQTLREENLEFRLKLRPLEGKLDNARGIEREQAEAHLTAAIESLAYRYSVKTTQDLAIRRIVALAKPAANLIALKPGDALEAAAAKLLSKDAETTLAELHKLQRNLPASAEQDADIRRLFDL
jgi:hypothetical protein